jgi:uncharacterized protein YegP (UPF0339 family)
MILNILKLNCSNTNIYDSKVEKNSKYRFSLTAINGHVIGSSQLYKSKFGMGKGITAVVKK